MPTFIPAHGHTLHVAGVCINRIGKKVSFGSLVVASANSFRHADEWAKTRTPSAQQKRSQEILDAALDPRFADDRRKVRSCSGALEVLSGGWSFDQLTASLLASAHDVAMRHCAASAA